MRDSSGKEVRRPLPLAGREACSGRILVPAGMRRITREGTSPCREGEVYRRRLRTSPESQCGQARGERIPSGDLLSPPGNAHGGRAAEVHYGGLAEGIITAAGE
jgi:hypothetical protein